MAVATGPWPGSFYTLPLSGIVAFGLVIAYFSLRTIATRPRSGVDPDSVSFDDALRRRSARAVVGACGVIVSIPASASA